MRHGAEERMRLKCIVGAVAGLALVAAATHAARAQDAAAEGAGSGDFFLENGAAAHVSDNPLGSIELAPDQRLSVRTYQYRDFGGRSPVRPGLGLGYRPSRNGDIGEARIDGIDDLSKAWEYGGILEYGYSDPSDPRTRAGIDLQIAPGSLGAGDGWLLQPGASYTTPFSERWQFNARVYSTLTSPNSASGALQLDSRQGRGGAGWMSSESPYKDVGVNLGLAYDVNENWRLGTGAGLSRIIGKPGDSASFDEKQSATQLFGGVVVKYKF